MELLSQTEAVFHLVLGVLMERARAIEDLLILLIVVALGARFIDGSDDVVWSVAAILTSLGLLADHGCCHNGNYGLRGSGSCGGGHQGNRHCGELGDECPHPH